MAFIELFTDPRLPCPQRVHLVIKELGIDVNIQDVNLEAKGHKVRYKSWSSVRIKPSLIKTEH
jgi:hypothetical protein